MPKLRNAPLRLATGAYILHTGLEKWKGDEKTAGFIHGMAANAIPQLREVPPKQFLKMLAGAEISLGTALLMPTVSPKIVGLGLTMFSAGLLTMYMRTPSLHKPGSVWPSQQGIGISKDVWMLGTGLGLILDKKAASSKEKKAA